jgi:hypothetical protein
MNEEQKIQLKINDVYSFRYNDSEVKKRFEPYHCFDRQLVVKDYKDGLMLVDTYWGENDNRTFTLEEALKQGTLTFKCNLDDVEYIKEWETEYYSYDDLFNLSHQHGCYTVWAKRKTALRDKDRMLYIIKNKIDDTEHNIESCKRDLVRMNETLQKIENGEIDNVYL